MNDLKDTVEPTLIASKSDIEDPTRDIPKIEKVDPNLAKLLRDKVEPK